MKRLIIILILFLIILGAVIGFRYFGNIQSQQKAVPPTPISGVTPPVFPTIASGQIAYALPPIAPSFPSGLPLFSTTTNTGASRFSKIARALGFSGNPKDIVGSRGNFSIWTNGPMTLTIGGDPTEISYTTGAKSSGSINQPAAQLRPIAEGLLQKAGLSTPSQLLVYESTTYFSPQGSILSKLNSSDGATLVQLNYRYVVGNYTVFTRRANTPNASVSINSRGEIVSLAAYWLPDLTKSTEEVTIIGYQGAVARITAGQGVLVSLSSTADNASEDIPRHNVSDSTINEVVLGYYYSTGQPVLAPVYVFRGTGIDNDTGKTVETITLVSALPSPSP